MTHRLARLAALAALVLALAIGCSSLQGPFSSEYVPGLERPELKLVNDASVEVKLALDGDERHELELAPRATKTLELRPGTYAYRAEARELAPARGRATFARDHRYVWTFVERERQREK